MDYQRRLVLYSGRQVNWVANWVASPATTPITTTLAQAQIGPQRGGMGFLAVALATHTCSQQDAGEVFSND